MADGPAALVLDLAADRFGLLGTGLVIHRHGGADLRQGHGGGPADTPAGPRHQGDLAFERSKVRCHGSYLSSEGGTSGSRSHASPISRFMWLLMPWGIFASPLPS